LTLKLKAVLVKFEIFNERTVNQRSAHSFF
jgi:hypothetical protein